MLIQIEYSCFVKIEEIKTFFCLFASAEDKIVFKDLQTDSKTVKRRKVDKGLETTLNKLNLKNGSELYTITINNTTVSSWFNSDIYSSDNLHFLINRHIAYHFGYSECQCGGFSVKNKENKKIQVEETIYIKNDINFIIPNSLNFVKSDKRNREDNVDRSYQIQFKTSSTILYSILSCKEVHFTSNETSYFLKRNEQTYVMYCEKKQDNRFNKLQLSRETQLSDFFKKFNKECSNILNKMYLKKDVLVIASFSKYKKLFEKDPTFLWGFLCVVPVFNDSRDLITEKLHSIYENLDHKKIIKRKGEYLEIRERRYVDSLKYNTLKRFYYTK